jgi:hypothetical protein
MLLEYTVKRKKVEREIMMHAEPDGKALSGAREPESTVGAMML